jgi:hypothetical protein
MPAVVALKGRRRRCIAVDNRHIGSFLQTGVELLISNLNGFMDFPTSSRCIEILHSLITRPWGRVCQSLRLGLHVIETLSHRRAMNCVI